MVYLSPLILETYEVLGNYYFEFENLHAIYSVKNPHVVHPLGLLQHCKSMKFMGVNLSSAWPFSNFSSFLSETTTETALDFEVVCQGKSMD